MGKVESMKKVVLALLATLTLAACSSSPSASSSPTAAAPKLEASVCTAITGKIGSVAQTIQGLGTTTSVNDAIAALKDASGAWTSQAAAATLPDTVAWLTSMSANADKLRAALTKGDFSKTTVATEKALVVDMLKIQTFCP